MSNVVKVDWDSVDVHAANVASQIVKWHESNRIRGFHLYGVPRGGIFAAQAVKYAFGTRACCSVFIVEEAEQADVIVDDIIDSTKTALRYLEKYPDKPFLALINKGTDNRYRNQWVSFPWERMTEETAGVEDNVRRLIEYIGDDPKREGLIETPKRVIRSYDTLFAGYKQNPEDVIKTFEDGSCDEMVLLKDIPMTSCCEHHILPFSGKAHIAYIPDKRVIGVSKLARILEIYARRLQIQERIGQQVTECLMTHLKPKGAACVLECVHTCMTCRGVQKSGATMVTSSLRGIFLENAQTRSEFMSMIKG